MAGTKFELFDTPLLPRFHDEFSSKSGLDGWMDARGTKKLIRLTTAKKSELALYLIEFKDQSFLRGFAWKMMILRE